MLLPGSIGALPYSLPSGMIRVPFVPAGSVLTELGAYAYILWWFWSGEGSRGRSAPTVPPGEGSRGSIKPDPPKELTPEEREEYERERAERWLWLAERLFEADNKAAAVRVLKKIVQRHPGTDAAERARALLEEIEASDWSRRDPRWQPD
jgi:hypothetical protein